MQPTYLPWAGYFNLISQVDFFVFLDDVQFEKQSWQSRNRILLNETYHFISVPVKHLSLTQKIREVECEDKHNWREKHVRLLKYTYTKHAFQNEMCEAVFDLIQDKKITLLADLNIRLIKRLSHHLGLETPFFLSSELLIEGNRSSRLLNICKKLGCDEYVSPVGSAEYLQDDGVFDQSSPVRLSFQNYKPSAYAQKGASEFVSHLSIVDVLANLGWEQARQYVMTGRVSF
ncbi:WbqC family protein [Brevibacillus choshinensis]|uniref:WbqC family protein n=1 Tax=Brevibacillus choshinensis TaxID=54911 RepID=UPI002E20C00B|nr:WbqC family protein [Brevibacillus choshinensis]MED4753931.1 WbqC family protein [Brevibacillus choshinensis]MED4779062.1 WbqC family protein [Brevibacillus choshinensis]